ncbi:MAG: AAA family ATPase [Acidimicrobiales bacterium]
MASDLFSSAAEDRLSGRAPLAERLRPRNLGEVLGQSHLVGPGRPLRTMVERGTLRSVILWGPAGTGKTTIARLVTSECGHAFEMLSAVTATVKDIRTVAEAATTRLGTAGTATVLFLDEIHRFTRSQQDALLPHVESGLLTLIGATTESPWATVNRPLLSRCTVLRLEPLDERELGELADRGLERIGATLTDGARRMIVGSADGDGRRLLTAIEMAADLASGPQIDEAEMTAALGAGIGHYDRGDHYDSASAFIKHMRAGNVDQAVAWVNHMLDGGEDPRFIARRIVIFASEDIGVADRSALLIATAAAKATEFVGMPEVRYHLTHATIVMARAPKSREVGEYMARAADTELLPPPG